MSDPTPIYNVPAPPTPGIHTTEFWLTAVSNIIGAILAVLAAYGLITSENQALWLALAQAVAVAVIPVALALINKSYINGRTQIKVAAQQPPQ
jgi:hypothetical protein